MSASQQLSIICVFFLVTGISGCATERRDPGLFVYQDAEGNLITYQIEPDQSDPDQKGPERDPERDLERDPAPAETTESDSAAPKSGSAQAYIEDHESLVVDEHTLAVTVETPADIVANMQAEDGDRFITYFGPDGNIIRERVDLTGARAAREEAKPWQEIEQEPLDAGNETLPGGYLETVSAVLADCCLAALDEARPLRPGQEIKFTFRDRGMAMINTLDGERPAVIIRLDDALAAIRITTYIRPIGYLHPFALFLDENGEPDTKINNLFTRRYAETWSRYGYLEGTLQRDERHKYMVLYIPYQDPNNGADKGISVEHNSQLASHGELVIRGIER